jgi:heme/copper-type cytochrome/quinol oxidase subunit 2
MTDRTFKRISKIVTLCLGLYGFNELAWWYVMTPAWEREAMFSDIGHVLLRFAVIAIVILVCQHIALSFWIRRAKPIDPETNSEIHEATRPRG